MTPFSHPSQPTIPGRWRKRIAQLWYQVTEPHSTIKEPERRRARMLSALLLALIFPGLLGLSLMFLPGVDFVSWLLSLMSIITLSAIYWLSRSRYYNAAALLTTLVILGSVISDVVLIKDARAADFLILVIIVASLFLTLRITTFVLIITMSAVVSLPAFIPGLSGLEIITSVYLIGVTGIVAIVGAVVRRQDLTQIEAQSLTLENEIEERKRAEEEIRRNAARAEVLVRTAGRLNTVLELDAVLNSLCEEVAGALGVPIVTVSLYDDTQNSLFLRASFGLTSTLHQRIQAVSRTVLDEYNSARSSVVVTPDVQALTNLPNADIYTNMNLRTTANVNMFYREQLIGRLNIGTLGETRHFTDDELALLHSIANQAAQALANAKLYTERVQAEEKIVHLQKRNELILNSAGEGICGLDLEGKTAFANPAALQLLGYTLEELSSKPQHDLIHHTHPDGRPYPQEECPIYATFKYGSTHHIDDEVFWRKDGSSIPVEYISRPMHNEDGKLIGAVVTFNDTTERKQAEELIKTQIQHLAALRAIDTAISSSTDLQFTLNVALDQVVTELGVDAADVLLFNPTTQTLKYISGRGFRTNTYSRTQVRLGDGQAGKAALERQIVAHPDLTVSQPIFAMAELMAGENFAAYYVVPLIAKGNVKGVLEIFHRAPLHPDDEWLSFLETLAGQVAITVDNATMFSDLYRSNYELRIAYDATIEGWSRALDLRDKETEGHSARVTEMTMRLAQTMGLSDEELVQIRRGALLHDMGKLGVPDHILLKPDKLTDEEWVAMRKHPTFAYELLLPIAYLRPALDIPYCHHEKWDGTGYPRGLKGEQIPLAARLFAIVDVWDALRSDRPYRPGRPEE